jgi:peptidyl-dipeptidase A
MKSFGLALVFFTACSSSAPKQPTPPPPPAQAPQPPAPPTTPRAPTAEEAAAFMKEVEPEILRLWASRERANWVKSTYITDDTDALAAQAESAVMEYTARRAAEATRFDKVTLPPDLRRKFMLLKISQTLPAPRDAKKRDELAGIAASMESDYGKGKYCSPLQKGKCLALGDLEDILAKSRDYDAQLDAWKGWQAVGAPMRQKFIRYVELANEGARELGFADLGDLWKSKYDMAPAAYEAEVDRLWNQVKPLYDDLHCYVRTRLQAKYGEAKVPSGGPIPAHLLGNMWAQEWGNLMDLLAPSQSGGIDLTSALVAKKVDEKGMIRYGERFFVSLGLTELPKSFWERSLFKKPADREVVCHASAWDVDMDDDLRIKMCVKINYEDFTVIHHELGHNYYQHYYRGQPPLFRDSANDGFHEGLGDTLALSVTPAYLKKLGLLSELPQDDRGTLLLRALDKVAFLPFGLLVDKWRWDVFAGKIKPAEYNSRWWELRTKYQGVAPAVPRSESDFDPAAKYHVPANVPYSRYFLASILQFQFHRALCRIAGHDGPLHTCSIYGNRAAGERLRAMMSMGLSRPWPEALKALTGDERMDAGAILAYFQPLHEWLRKENQGKKCGW